MSICQTSSLTLVLAFVVTREQRTKETSKIPGYPGMGCAQVSVVESPPRYQTCSWPSRWETDDFTWIHVVSGAFIWTRWRHFWCHTRMSQTLQKILQKYLETVDCRIVGPLVSRHACSWVLASARSRNDWGKGKAIVGTSSWHLTWQELLGATWILSSLAFRLQAMCNID